jgi:hypothetical protein
MVFNETPRRARCYLSKRGGDVPQLELFIGPDSIEVVPNVRNLRFVLNWNLTPVDHY